jgi:heptosyltransferase-2
MERINIVPQNIIVKMPNWLGDAVMATPILQDLKGAFPDSKVTALCQQNVAPLLQKDPYLDEVISYVKPNGWIHRAEHHDVIDALQKGSYDAGLLLTNSFSSAWWFWRGKVQNRVGFAKLSRSWLLNAAIPFPKNIERAHLVNVYKELLAPFGIPVSKLKPKLYLGDDDLAFRKDFFQINKIESDAIVVGINPGASYGSAKCWPPERFREVAKSLLVNPNVVVMFFGDARGADLVKEICHDMPGRVINLAGKTTIRELMALIAGCSVFLTNDSGPMHIASAFNVPLLALFGSTNATKTGPFNGGRVLDKKVECSPCYKRECPIDFRCMKKITAEEVYQQLSEIISEIPKK